MPEIINREQTFELFSFSSGKRGTPNRFIASKSSFAKTLANEKLLSSSGQFSVEKVALKHCHITYQFTKNGRNQ